MPACQGKSTHDGGGTRERATLHLRSLFREVSDREQQGLSPPQDRQRREELSTLIQGHGDTAQGPRAELKNLFCFRARDARAARVTQEAEIPLVRGHHGATFFHGQKANSVSPPSMGNTSVGQIVPLWGLLAQVGCTVTAFPPPRGLRRNLDPSKQPPRGARDGFGEPGRCHRARGCSTETAGEAAAGVKSLLMTTKSNCGLFNFILFFLNATSFSGSGLIVVIKVARRTLSLRGMRGGLREAALCS